MQPIESDIVLRVLKTAGVVFEGRFFLRKLFGPSADVFGDTMADRLRTYLNRNTAKVVSRAEAQTLAIGKEPSAVPLRVLLPLLHHASIEDDEGLQERWAALLAHSAIGEERIGGALYVNILAQLTPFCARIFDAVILGPLPPLIGWHAVGITPTEMAGRMDVELTDVAIAVDALESLGLVEREPALGPRGATVLTAPIVGSGNIPVHATDLGKSFHAACTPKAPAQSTLDRSAR